MTALLALRAWLMAPSQYAPPLQGFEWVIVLQAVLGLWLAVRYLREIGE